MKDAIDNVENTTNTEKFFIYSLSILTSLMVVTINMVLGKIIRILSAYEKHETYSKYHLSVATKLTIAMFINTGIVPMFVNFGRKNWFKPGGLMVDITFNIGFISVYGPFINLINPFHLMKKVRKFYEKSKGRSSTLTQRQANQLFEGPALDIAQRYANTMLLFLLIVFYSFPLPFISLFGIIGVFYQYSVEKYLLLRRHKMPEPLGPTMAMFFISSVPYVCFLYGLSILIFSDILSEGQNKVGLFVFLFTLIYLFLPVRT